MAAAFHLLVAAPFREYHAYKTYLEPDVGEKITFERESGIASTFIC